MFMKEWICTIAGIVGGFIATLFGGWDSALACLFYTSDAADEL